MPFLSRLWAGLEERVKQLRADAKVGGGIPEVVVQVRPLQPHQPLAPSLGVMNCIVHAVVRQVAQENSSKHRHDSLLRPAIQTLHCFSNFCCGHPVEACAGGEFTAVRLLH